MSDRQSTFLQTNLMHMCLESLWNVWPLLTMSFEQDSHPSYGESPAEQKYLEIYQNRMEVNVVENLGTWPLLWD
jgi:hypothetical protein